jgi:hypothetical protein
LGRAGYGLFADDLDAIRHYAGEGGRCYAVDHDRLTPIGDLADSIRLAWADEDARPAGYEGLDADEVLALFDPRAIVDSAEGYDDEALVGWLWGSVLEDRDVLGVRTEDGAVVFCASLVDDLGPMAEVEVVS